MKTRLTLIPVLSFLFLRALSAQEIYTLDRILDSIRQNHPVVKMYTREIRSMDEAAEGARSWMPPQFAIGSFMTPYNINRWSREGEMTGMGSIMISGEQMLPNKKKLDAEERYMKAMSFAEYDQRNNVLHELVHDAKSLFFETMILNKKLAVLGSNRQILEFMVQNAESRYQFGLGKIGAYYKAKAALGNLKNMQWMIESEIRDKHFRINTLMGRNPTIPLELDTLFHLNDFSLWVFDQALFFSNRSDIRALDQRIRLNWLRQDAEKQTLRPQFGLRYEHMFGFGGQPLLFNLMGMVSIPMVKWSSKMTRANIESLKWQAMSYEAKKEMLANEYSGMAYAMRNELQLKIRQLSGYEETIIPALKNNLQTMQLGYEQNTEELFMLYDAWEALNMKQLEYFDLLNQALRSQVELERLIQQK